MQKKIEGADDVQKDCTEAAVFRGIGCWNEFKREPVACLANRDSDFLSILSTSAHSFSLFAPYSHLVLLCIYYNACTCSIIL